MNSGRNRSGLEDALADVELLRSLFDEIDEGICVVDRERRIRYWNHRAAAITGYLKQDVAGQICGRNLLNHCDADGSELCGAPCLFASALAGGKRWEATVSLRHMHGHRLPVRVRVHAVRSAGEVVGALALFESAVAPGRAEPGLFEDHCGVDKCTRSANRQYGEVKLAHALEYWNRFGLPIAWMGFELDGIEALEHRFGQGVVETAMRVAARTLDSNLATGDVAIRWTRTGFRVLVYNIPALEVADLARRILGLMGVSRLEWWGDPLGFSVSAATVTPVAADSPDSLELRLGRLLGECRERGGNCALGANDRSLDTPEPQGPEP